MDVWLLADRPFMETAHGMIVCKMPSWELSKGMEHERQFFIDSGKPVIYMEPNTVPEELLDNGFKLKP